MITPTDSDNVIQGILLSPNETRSVELKPCMDWPSDRTALQNHLKAQEIIVSILAMSNTADGGLIIVGVKKDTEGKYSLEGVKEESLATYDQDNIFEQVRSCGDPEPQFEVLNIAYESKNYIVFDVKSFAFTPIVSRNSKNLPKLDSGFMYIRTFKPESKKAVTPTDVRSIVDLSVEKELTAFSSRVQNLISNGQLLLPSQEQVQPNSKHNASFNEELEDLKNG